jgi:hypothetical protein
MNVFKIDPKSPHNISSTDVDALWGYLKARQSRDSSPDGAPNNVKDAVRRIGKVIDSRQDFRMVNGLGMWKYEQFPYKHPKKHDELDDAKIFKDPFCGQRTGLEARD